MKKQEILKELLKSLKEAVEDGEAVIIDWGCGEVTDMIESCGIAREETVEVAKKYEREALALAEKEGWKIIEINNCKAVAE